MDTPEALDDDGGDDKLRTRGALLVLTVSCCGIVFGDLATSPIYAFREAFSVLEPSEVRGLTRGASVHG